MVYLFTNVIAALPELRHNSQSLKILQSLLKSFTIENTWWKYDKKHKNNGLAEMYKQIDYIQLRPENLAIH